jgi:uncharacterized protein YukE
MSGSAPFNEGVVQQNGGVAWAKQQGQVLETVPDAIDSQIAGYKAAIQQLQQVHTSVTNGSTQLQSAWSGSASDAATSAFSDTAKQTQNTIDMINSTITQLQSAKAAAQTAATALAKVPDEKPVPKPGLFAQALNATGIESDGVSAAEQHNTQARTQAADALNTLSTSYHDTATNMNSIAKGGQTSGFDPSNGSSAPPFTIAGGPSGPSTGAAGSYQSTVGANGGGGSGKTTTRLESGTGTVEAPPITGSPTPPPGTTGTGPGTGTVAPDPILGSPVPDPTATDPEGPIGTTTGSNLEETDPMMGSTTGGPDGEGEGTGYGSASSLFGEDGFESTTGAGGGYGSTSAYGSTSGSGSAAGLGEEDAVGVGTGEGSTSGMQNMSGMRGGMGRGGGGAGAGDETYNSQYSRGQYLSDEEGSGFATQDWQSPAIGGDESLLIPSQVDDAAGPSGQVTSVYDGATDAQGRPMSGGMGMGGRRGQSGDDEEEERGRRPAYLKEDAEWWQSGQQYNPPVVG